MLCNFCENGKAIGKCRCGFDPVLKCGDRAACLECQQAHRTIARFFVSLMATKRAERANSQRHRYLLILLETFGYLRRDFQMITNRTGVYDYFLKQIDAFGPDEIFQADVRRLLVEIPEKFLNATFANGLVRITRSRMVEFTFERLSDAVGSRREERSNIEAFLSALANSPGAVGR